MKDKKEVPQWLSALLVVLILGCMAWTVRSIIRNPVSEEIKSALMIFSVLVLLLLVFSLAYRLGGYKKDAALYFMGYIHLYALTTLVAALGLRSIADVHLPLCETLSFGILCAMAIAKDLGRRKSFILCGVLILCKLMVVVVTLVNKAAVTGGIVSDILLAVMLGIMVYAKYEDKKSRGRDV